MLVFVTEHRELHRALLHRLSSRGIFAFCIPFDAALPMCKSRDTGGVLLDAIGSLDRAETLCRTLLSHYPELPVAALVAEHAVPDMPLSRIIRKSSDGECADEVSDFCRCNCGFHTGSLSTHELVLGEDPAATLYMGYSLHLSPQEHRILQYLFYRAPRPSSTDDLLALCYPDEEIGRGTLSVLIHRINTRAARIDPRRLIVRERDGYCLRAGILTLPKERIKTL